MQEVLIGKAQAVFQLGLIGPAQVRCLADVQQFAGCAVGLGGIPLDFAGVAYDLGDKLGQLLDGQLLAGSRVDGLIAALVVHKKYAQVGEVVYIEKFT